MTIGDNDDKRNRTEHDCKYHPVFKIYLYIIFLPLSATKKYVIVKVSGTSFSF